MKLYNRTRTEIPRGRKKDYQGPGLAKIPGGCLKWNPTEDERDGIR